MKLTPTLFPANDSDEVLFRGEGEHGNFIIFHHPNCQDHIHFQLNITGIKGAGIYVYDPASETAEKAAADCLIELNKIIEMEVADERSNSTLQ